MDANEILYKNLEKLQLDLNNLVRKAEDVRQVTQDVSYQATLKRLCTTFNAIFNQRQQKAYFPAPTDQESFERKFKLLRRSTYLLHDEMREIRKFLTNLHDATRLQKQQMYDNQKFEKIGEDIEIITMKQEQPKILAPPPQYQQIINIDEEEDFAIVPKEEPPIEIPDMLSISSACERIFHISCTCQLQAQLQMKLPFEVKLCIAIESLSYFNGFLLNTQIIEECQENPLKCFYSDMEDCISYELIYLIEKNPLKRQLFIEQYPTYTMPYIQLEIDRKVNLENEHYFPLFMDLYEIGQNNSIFVYTFLQLANTLKSSSSIQKGGHFKYLVKYMHIRQKGATVINAYSVHLDRSQILTDFFNAMVNLNRNNIIIGVNTLQFPETMRNPKIILSRYTRNLNKVEQNLLADNLDTGCRISPKGTKEPRLIIIFTKEKLHVPSIVGRLKHWEIPIEHLNQIQQQYHYKFQIYYVDLVIRTKFKDRLSKYYTLLLTALRDNVVIQENSQIKQQFEQFVNNKDYINYFIIKTLNENKDEQYLEELLCPQRVKSNNSDIAKLLGLIEE